MAYEEIPIIDPDVYDAPTIDENDHEPPKGKPRPAPPRPKSRPAKKPRQPVAPTPPSKLPYGMQIKDVVQSLRETPQERRMREIQEATKAYESTLIKEPQPHKFVPKTGPPIRDLGAEEAQFEQMLQDAERRKAIDKIASEYAGKTAPGYGAQLLNRFGRGYVGSMASMLKGPTLLNPNAKTDPTTKFLYQSPEENRSMLQKFLPVNEYNNSFVMRASEAIGSSVPFLIGGAAGEAAGLPAWMMSSVLGAVSNAGSTYDDAMANGADEQTARYSAIVGALIGLTEGLGVGRMGLPEAHGGAAFATPLMQRLRQMAMSYGKEGVEEWLQEYGSQVLNNVNAMVISGYDPKRAIQEGVWDAGGMAFFTGAFMGGVHHGIGGMMTAMDPEYRAAKKEYLQAQLIDKAFKDFMKGTNSGDLRQIGVIQGGKAPSAPQFQRGPIEAATIPPKHAPMVPDMAGAMASKVEDEEVPWNYSQLERAVTEKFPNKMMPDQAMAMLTPYGSKYGIKQEEYANSGLDELLARKTVKGEPVTKDELLSVIRDASLGIKEVVKGDLPDPNNEAAIALRDDIADARVQIDQFRIHTNTLVRQQAELDKIFEEGGMEWEEYSSSIDKLSEQVRQNEAETIAVQRRMQEMEDQLSTGVNDSRYESYKALAGGTPGSYRELLITLPKNEPNLEPADWTTAGGGGDTANFMSGHFNEPNVLVHARLDEGTDADGNKVLRIQEIQSDWHQQGREKGYEPRPGSPEREAKDKKRDEVQTKLIELEDRLMALMPPHLERHRGNAFGHHSQGTEYLRRNYPELMDERARLENEFLTLNTVGMGIPDAPFKQTWSDLAFKRLIRWAADKGYKRLVWTTGAQQIDLYQGELRRNVDTISLLPSQYGRKGSYDIIGWKDGKRVIAKDMLEEQEVRELLGSQITGTLLEKLTTNPNRADVSGSDLSIGGQMHKLLYDQKLPQLARDYVRKYGGQTGKTQVRVDTNDDTSPIKREPIYKDVHYLDLSPKLIEKATKEGFPLYSRKQSLPAEGVPRGAETTDDLTFDVMPALSSEYGRAPYMRAPQWFFDAIGDSDSAGVNYGLGDVADIKDKLFMKAPTMDHLEAAMDALNDLVQQTRAEGLRHISFVNTSEPEEGHRGVIEHEVTHTAQRAGLVPALDWLRNHPMISNVLYRRIDPKMGMFSPTVREKFFDQYEKDGNDKVLKVAAMEMMTYWVQGRSDRLKMSNEEGKKFFKEYIDHMRDEYGQEGVDKFMTIARLRPEVLQAVGESNREWGAKAVMAPFGVSDMPMEMEGSFAARSGKKGPFQKMRDWFTKAGRQVLEENPPAPDVPEDLPDQAPPPPEPPGRQPGGGAQGPLGPLFKEMVSPEYNQLLTRTFRKMLEEGGVQNVDPVEAPFLQVFNALKSGELQNVDIEKMLEDEGLSIDVFADELKETASMAGKTLQSYSEIARFWNTILDEYEVALDYEEDEKRGKVKGGATGPRLPKSDLEALLRLVPTDVRVRKALKGVRNSALGKTWWQRSGNITQKAMLTQLSTYTVNTMTTSGQLPLRIATQGMGAWFYHMIEDKGSFSQRLSNANQDAWWAMRAGMEVIVAMNPAQLVQWAQGRGSYTNFAKYQTIVSQLEKSFPELHKKLFALSSGTETLRKGKRDLSMAQALVDKVKDNAKRKELLAQIKEYEERLESNTKAIGKLMNKTEMVYDFCMQPMQVAEYFLRRPMFVGQLTLELQREGINLAQVLAYNAFDQIPRPAMERAVNRALEFTYAYMPGTKTGTNHKTEQAVEKAAAGLIEWLNRNGGPLNAIIGEPFGKALFNGAKFVYEYSPVGGILPFNRIVQNWRKERIATRLNNQIRSGFNPTAIATTPKGITTDPLQNYKKEVINPTNREDYDRLAKAMLGTLMYATVHFLRAAYGGPEWWQIKTEEKGPDGRPIYYDIRRLKPFSALFQIHDLVQRAINGNMGDQNFWTDLSDAVAGIRMYDNQMGGSIIESTADWFRHEDVSETWAGKAQEDIGKAMAIYLTPLMNLQDCIAQFSAEENVKKDTRGSYSVLGPVMDKIPFLRRLLPNLTSPVEPGPIQRSVNPMMTQFMGEKKVVGENFAGREWRRLGLFNKSFIPRDPDPVINRAMNQAFLNAVGQLAEAFESDPAYLNADDKQKKMMWEVFIGGDKGFANMAKQIGELANPKEALRRSMERGAKMGRFTKEALGYHEMLKKMMEEQDNETKWGWFKVPKE